MRGSLFARAAGTGQGGTKWHRERGSTLVELLVVLVIVSVLAVAALPMAEASFQRRKELDLRETLRLTRAAIDAFHADWTDQIMVEPDEVASATGYPRTLAALVDGVEVKIDDRQSRRRYLRRLPRNPFAQADADMADQWRLIGYEQAEAGDAWNRIDVYDLRPVTEKEALDGSAITDW